MALEMYLQQGRAWHNCRTSVRSTKDAIWSRISGGMDSSVRFVSFEGTVWIDGPRTFQAAYMEMNVNGLERIRLYLRKYMSLRDNTLNSFPATLNKWTSLTSILLSDSGLVGKIPESIKHLRNLKELVLSCNRFDGTEIPASIMELAHLEVLMLNGCRLVGALGVAFAQFLETLKRHSLLNITTNSLEWTEPNIFGVFGVAISDEISDGVRQIIPNKQMPMNKGCILSVGTEPVH